MAEKTWFVKVSVHVTDPFSNGGYSYNDNWAAVEAEDEMDAINAAIRESFRSFQEDWELPKADVEIQGDYMPSPEDRITGLFVGTPRLNASAADELGSSPEVAPRSCPSCGCGSPAHTADCEQADAA